MYNVLRVVRQIGYNFAMQVAFWVVWIQFLELPISLFDIIFNLTIIVVLIRSFDSHSVSFAWYTFTRFQRVRPTVTSAPRPALESATPANASRDTRTEPVRPARVSTIMVS